MSKIGGQTGGASGLAAQTPWDNQASSEVRGLRRAVTEHLPEKTVGSDLAPMMSELLARLDTFAEGESHTDLEPPRPPSRAEPPSPAEAASAFMRASDKVRDVAARVADPGQRASLTNLAKVLDRHVHMRQEVLMRSRM